MPNQNALKFVLSVINKILPFPLLITLNGTEFFNSDIFSSEIYPLINGLDEYDIGFFLKRARVAEQIFGSSKFHTERYANLSGF